MYLLFSFSTFRQGMHDLKVWPGVEADGNFPSTTIGKNGDEDQMSKLSKVSTDNPNLSFFQFNYL